MTGNTRRDVLADEADSPAHPWYLVMVSSLGGQDGRLVTSEEMEPYLQDMVETVTRGGNLSRYAVFARAGSPVRLTTEGSLSDG